jgi:hypothetical protein
VVWGLSMSHWLAKILLVPIGLIVALVLCEVGLRLAGIGYPHFFKFDPYVGTGLRPGIKGYWLKEGGGYVSINSDGLRDREHAIKKPPNTVRIAVLGDSYTEALQVNQEEDFCSIMEKKLQSCKNLRGRDIEVINFGQSGFGTTQELLTLEHRVWKYAPDIILLAFCTGNDMADNSPILNQRTSVPFFVFQDGTLVLDDSRIKRAEKVWSFYETHRNWLGRFYIWRNDTFRILQLMDYSWQTFQDWWSPKDSGGMLGSVRQGAVEPGIFTDIYREPTDADWNEAWKVTEAILLKMRDEIAKKSAQFYVVVLSNDVQVNPDVTVWQKQAAYPGVEDIFYPDHRVEKFCRSHGIPVLLLGPPFQEYASQHQVFLHGFKTMLRNDLGSGHWNQNGHRLAGQLIAQWLCPRLN